MKGKASFLSNSLESVDGYSLSPDGKNFYEIEVQELATFKVNGEDSKEVPLDLNHVQNPYIFAQDQSTLLPDEGIADQIYYDDLEKQDGDIIAPEYPPELGNTDTTAETK